MYDYGNYYYVTDSNTGSTGGFFAGLLAMGSVFWLISAAISVLIIISMWMIFKKNGKEGWIAIIPFYNMWTFFEICNIPGWMIFIPFANIVYMYIAYYRIAIKMGKSSGFGVLCIFFPFVCLPILAFSKTNVVNTTANNYQQPVNNQQQTMNQQAQQSTYQSPQQPVSDQEMQQTTEPAQNINQPAAELQQETINQNQSAQADTNATVIMPNLNATPDTVSAQQVPSQESISVELTGETNQVSDEGFKFCTNCGNKSASNMKFCDNCGKEFN